MQADRRQFVAMAASGVLAAPGLAWARPAFDRAAAWKVIEDFARSDGFYGVVLLGQAGRTVKAQAYGEADIESGSPAGISTRYGIASISKWLTSAMVLRLVDQGRLSLDATISAVLPEFRPETGARVRLRHLLSNTSGIPNGYLTAVKADPALMDLQLETGEAVRRYAGGDLAFAPGASFDYSTTNWIVVRAMVERVTGATFESAMQSLLLKPLGLRDTGAPILGASPPVATPYGTLIPAPVRKLQLNPAFAVAGGGYYSTVEDLNRAADAILRPGLLTAASRDALMHVEFAEQHYALGGRIKDLTLGGRPRRLAWETGNAGGYKSLLAYAPDDRRALVMLNNSNITQKRLDEVAVAALGAAYGA